MSSFTDLTFMLPIYIDSPDRLRNVRMVLPYLVHCCPGATFRIQEYPSASSPEVRDVVGAQRRLGASITYQELPARMAFHRTRCLNEMLAATTTALVTNYDIDVLLPPWMYDYTCSLLRKDADLVYPYGFVHKDGRGIKDATEKEAKFLCNFGLDTFQNWVVGTTETGHALFARTEAYAEMGGESELFCCYGPEDRERCLRAHRLGLRIKYLPGGTVYHLEHSRHVTSGRGKGATALYALPQLYNILHALKPDEYAQWVAITKDQFERTRRQSGGSS